MAINTKSVILSGTVNYAVGKFGNCLTSDGTTGNAASIEGFSVAASTPFTISFWMKTTVSATLQVMVSGWGSGNYIGLASGKLRVVYSTSGNLTGATSLNDGNWHHVEVGWGAGGMIGFVDGVQQVSSALVSMPGFSTTTSLFSLFNLNNANFFSGSIDDVALWNTQLHTANFTPPTLQADTSDVNLLTVAQLDAAPTDTADGTVHIAPNNAAILYSPYTWDVNSTTATTIDTGAYFKVVFTGNSVTLKFDLQYNLPPYPQIYVRIDGVNYSWQKFTIASSVVVTMPADTIAATSHYLEVYVKSCTSGNWKWNGFSCAIKFKGLILQTSAKTVSAPTAQLFNILALGDSITEGAWALNNTATDQNDSFDGMTSWANQLNMLGAEVGVVGFSSVGVNKLGLYGVPAVISSYNLLYRGVSRSFTPVPDAIVINLGTNDQSSITAGLTTLLNGLLTATANNTQIFVLLPFNGGGTNASPAIIQAGIAACNAPGKVVYVDTTGFLSGTTDGLHPAAWAATSKLTQKVQQVIRPYLNNKRRGFAKMY
jgi:lysophospholipase L1-like esterase